MKYWKPNKFRRIHWRISLKNLIFFRTNVASNITAKSSDVQFCQVSNAFPPDSVFQFYNENLLWAHFLFIFVHSQQVLVPTLHYLDILFHLFFCWKRLFPNCLHEGAVSRKPVYNFYSIQCILRLCLKIQISFVSLSKCFHKMSHCYCITFNCFAKNLVVAKSTA